MCRDMQNVTAAAVGNAYSDVQRDEIRQTCGK